MTVWDWAHEHPLLATGLACFAVTVLDEALKNALRTYAIVCARRRR